MDSQNTDNTQPRCRRTVTIVVVSLVSVFILLGVLAGFLFVTHQNSQNELRAFTNAIISTEPQVLENYLEMYADAPADHLDSVSRHLQDLQHSEADWLQAVRSNTSRALLRFLQQHPQSVHSVEAALVIDSLDWCTAVGLNTAEAYQQYLLHHSDGTYYDEAQAAIELCEEQQLSVREITMVSRLLTSFFNALAQGDETALQTTLAPVLSSFQLRPAATFDDVRAYMEQLHHPDVAVTSYTPNDDWQIERLTVDDGAVVYKTLFTITQYTEFKSEAPATFTICQVTAQVSEDARIIELNIIRSQT